jgi:hypothetical protein
VTWHYGNLILFVLQTKASACLRFDILEAQKERHELGVSHDLCGEGVHPDGGSHHDEETPLWHAVMKACESDPSSRMVQTASPHFSKVMVKQLNISQSSVATFIAPSRARKERSHNIFTGILARTAWMVDRIEFLCNDGSIRAYGGNGGQEQKVLPHACSAVTVCCPRCAEEDGPARNGARG